MKRRTLITTILTLSLVISTFPFTATDAYTAGKAANSKPKATDKPNKKQQQMTKPQQKPAPRTLNELKPIGLTAKSSVKLSNINMYKQDEENILTYTLTYDNKEQQSIPLIDYWTKVRTKSGNKYDSHLTTKDKEKKVVPANSPISITFYAKVAKHLTVHDLYIDVIKWDFDKPNFEYQQQLGSFQIPNSVMTSTGAGESSIVFMNNIPIQMSMDGVTVFPSGDATNVVNVTVNVENMGYKTLEAPTYKYVLKTAAGSTYSLVPDASSKDYKLQPREKKTLRFTTEIPKTVILNKLAMQILMEDELATAKPNESSKMFLPVATLMLPKFNQGNLNVPAQGKKVLTLDDAKISTKITAGRVSQSFEQNEIMLTFEFENLTNRPVKVPKYEFVLNGPNGMSVPVATNALDSLTLPPLEKRSIPLQVKVKADIATSHLKLRMNRPSETDRPVDTEQKEQKDVAQAQETKFKYPEGIYALPELQSMSDQTGVEYDAQYSKGSFGITLESLQRLSWLNVDILSAKLKIRNKESKTIQLPQLEGLYKLDAADIAEKTQLISSNGALIIGPKDEVDVYVVTKVPSRLDFSQVQIALVEKIDDKVSRPVIQFTNGSQRTALPVVEHGSTHRLKTQGRKADITVLNSKVYNTGKADQIIYTDLTMESQEDRETTLSQMVGYYRTEDGRPYKAAITQVQGSTNSREKNILTAWAKVPSSVDPKKLQLVIGEGTTGDKFTSSLRSEPSKNEAGKGESGKSEFSKDGSDGYVNAVAMNLDVVQASAKTDFKDIDLFPYKLTLSSFQATANKTSNLAIEFTYDLTREQEYNLAEYGHELIVEITDTSGRKFEKALEIGTGSQKGDSKDSLEEAKGKSFSTSITDTFFEQVEHGAYQVALYDSFGDQRIKLASYGSVYNVKLNHIRRTEE